MNKARDKAVVTIWFVSAPDAHSFLATNPTSDFHYAHRLVGGLFPNKPITALGSFPLTRSVPAGKDEVYVGTYPGITVIQTAAIPVTTMSELVPQWVQPEAAADIYAFAEGSNGEFAGFAHWQDGKLLRAFTATATNIEETIGLPDSAEGPYWAGEFPNKNTPEFDDPFAIPLPFLPGDILLTMYTKWMGFSPTAEHLELNVNGFALDGRPPVHPMDRIVPPDEEDLPARPTPGIGAGANAEELTAAEMEEATGTVVDDPSGEAAEDKDRKPSLWTRFKHWWFGDKVGDGAATEADYADDDYADDEYVEDGYGEEYAEDYASEYDQYEDGYAEDYPEEYPADYDDSYDGYNGYNGFNDR